MSRLHLRTLWVHFNGVFSGAQGQTQQVVLRFWSRFTAIKVSPSCLEQEGEWKREQDTTKILNTRPLKGSKEISGLDIRHETSSPSFKKVSSR